MPFLRQNIWRYLLLAALMAIPLFGHLNTLPIRIWDESRLAINAYEMFKNGNYLVTHFMGKPDMWNSKPPLMIWVQVLGMKLIGVNELAVRLPSALAAFFTSLALLFFSQRYLGNFWFGFLAVFILITIPGYVGLHGTRTGDYDALLTLFMTLSALFFFAWCEQTHRRWLYLTALSLSLAVLTKGIAGLMLLPGLFLYLLLRKKLGLLLRSSYFYAAILLFIVPVGSYYLLRESVNPSYLAAIWENELGGRFAKAQEGHEGNLLYYLRNFWDFRMSYWILFVPAGLLTGLFMKNKRFVHLAQFAGLTATSFLLVISLSQTKLKWYDLPIYPFFALLAAIFVYYWFNFFREMDWARQTLRVNVMPGLFLFILGASPYMHILKKTYLPRETSQHNREFYALSYYLRQAVKREHDLSGQHLLYPDYKAHLLFYVHLLNDHGMPVDFKKQEDLKTGDIAIASNYKVKKYVEEHYEYKILRDKFPLKTYEIHGRKK